MALTSTSTLLEHKNPHKRDSNIIFEEKEHKYTICGEEGYTSVTTWIHTHFGHFDADAIISTMMSSKKWTSSPYYNKTREEIKAEWDKNRDEAANAGTQLHYAIECYYNNVINDVIDDVKVQDSKVQDSKEYNYFMNFVKSNPQLKPYRTEWMVYHEDIKIAGSIDMVYENPDGTLMIYDWKRSKEIKKTPSFNKYSTTDCISHLPDTNFWHYALQLNIYKAILQEKYGKIVTDLYLVGLHPDNKNNNYILLKVPDLQNEIKDLFELRKTQIISNSII